MTEYVYGRVIGAKERTLSDGRKVYDMVTVEPHELSQFNPPGFPGWFVARPDGHGVVLIQPGYTVRQEVINDAPAASPVTLRA